MTITHHIKIDMVKRLVPPRVYAMQHDTNTRVMEMDLTSNGESWVPPEDVSFALSYQKPDGKRGFYNQLTEGVSAVTVNGSKVSVVLAPQVMTTPGTVFAALVMNDVNMDRLASFPVEICVIADPSAGTTQSDDYFNCFGWSASVHYTPQDLTPSEQAQARENIGAADAAFVGDSAAALDAIIEMQEALLNASGTLPDDYGTPYAVEYIKQELTEVAKAQARENIGAAPAGFGLGEETAAYVSDVHTINKIGFYRFDSATANKPSHFPHGTISANIADGVIYLTATYAELQAKSYYGDDGWNEWEYVNPILHANREYRTTERWLGRAVYTKVLNVGAFPAEGGTSHFGLFSQGETEDYSGIRILRVTGNFGNRRVCVPYRDDEAQISISGTTYEGFPYVVLYVEKGDFTADTCIAQVWYTKD